jgi:hypothetical protein
VTECRATHSTDTEEKKRKRKREQGRERMASDPGDGITCNTSKSKT